MSVLLLGAVYDPALAASIEARTKLRPTERPHVVPKMSTTKEQLAFFKRAKGKVVVAK